MNKEKMEFTDKDYISLMTIFAIAIIILSDLLYINYGKSNDYIESLVPVDATIIGTYYGGDGNDFEGELSYCVTTLQYGDKYFTTYDPDMYRVATLTQTSTCRIILYKKEYSDGTITYEFYGPNDG